MSSSNYSSGKTGGRRFPQPSMDETLAIMPKRKLTEEDFEFNHYKPLRERVKHEDSLPPEHIPPVDPTILLSTLKATMEFAQKEDIRIQFVIDRPQVFSSAKMEDLSQLKIRDLMVRKRHKGNFLLVRTICPPVYDGGTAVLLCVEDPAGDFAYLKLLNHAILLHTSYSDLGALLRIGTILAIREPTYSMNHNVPELPFIKVESPSDVVFVGDDDPLLRNFPRKGVLKDVWATCPTSGEAWKAEGIHHFKALRWLPAAVSFTNCIKSGFEAQLSRLNRSEVYLRLSWNNSALCDAQEALKMGTLSADLNKKAIIRMIKALYALHRYEAIIEASKLLPNDSIVVEWVTKTNKRIKEEKTGIYDWPSLIKRSIGRQGTFDLANYTAPIEVKTNANGLRGTYAIRDMKAGELVMVENPLSTVPHKEYTGAGIFLIHLPSRLSTDNRDIYHLSCETLRRFWDDEHLYAVISSLFSGQKSTKQKSFPRPSIDSRPLEHPLKPKVDIDVDMVYLATICNAFDSGEELSLYGRSSLLNHSCVPNTHRAFFGNVAAIRTLQDIKEGEEITIAYIEGSHSYDERRYRLMNTWRFNCSCESCRADDGDRNEVRETRRKLLKEMLALRREFDALVFVGQAVKALQTVRRLSADGEKICDGMRRTYHEGHRGLKFELAEALEIRASIMNLLVLRSSRRDLASFKEVLELKFEILEMRGLKVTDRSITGGIPGGKKGKKRTFPIDSSGISAEQEKCGQTVLEISHIFKEVGDMDRSKRWFDAAVWMDRVYCGGDMESFKAHHMKALSTLGLSVHF